MKPRILVVDDSAELRLQLREAFKSERFQGQPYEVFEAGDVADLKSAMTGPQPDVVLLDVVLPSGDGLTLLPQIKKQWPDTQVILMTGVLDGEEKINAAVEATKRGAFHFLSKPFNLANLMVTVERAIEHKRAEEERRALREELIASGGIRPVFKSAAMQAVIATVEKIAASDASVLITGETGT
ncbi:MAG: response regulator, partial [Verrucomicrobiales bacterium]|nr:response regulator [Verrucomicrobiales bacterium]